MRKASSKSAGAYLQLVKERNTLENLLRQGREGVPVQPPLGVEGTRPAKRRRQVSQETAHDSVHGRCAGGNSMHWLSHGVVAAS